MIDSIIVRPDKNVFLFYAFCAVQNLDCVKDPSLFNGTYNGVKDPLREETVRHFQGYVNPSVISSHFDSSDYHFVLTLNEAPDFSQKAGISSIEIKEMFSPRMEKTILEILPSLEHFYETMDFERYYQSILPRYKAECDQLQDIVDSSNLIGILDSAWEFHSSNTMEVIPMPLEGTACGLNTSIGNTTYQIIGPPFDKRALGLIAHEASHPRAKRILGSIADEIQKRDYLWMVAKHGPNFSRVPNRSWWTYFEDQFIKAMEVACMDSELMGLDADTAKKMAEKRLKFYENKGWIFTREFFQEIKQYKAKHSSANLADVGIVVLKRLEKSVGYVHITGTVSNDEQGTECLKMHLSNENPQVYDVQMAEVLESFIHKDVTVEIKAGNSEPSVQAGVLMLNDTNKLYLDVPAPDGSGIESEIMIRDLVADLIGQEAVIEGMLDFNVMDGNKSTKLKKYRITLVVK